VSYISKRSVLKNASSSIHTPVFQVQRRRALFLHLLTKIDHASRRTCCHRRGEAGRRRRCCASGGVEVGGGIVIVAGKQICTTPSTWRKQFINISLNKENKSRLKTLLLENAQQLA
jgi:hypothetical protein